MRAASARALCSTLLLASGCGRGAGPAHALPFAEGERGFPVRVHEGGGRVVFVPRRPERVLLANAHFVDIVTRLVEPARVVALPEQALTWTRLVDSDGGFRAKATFRKADVERVAAMAPDLVLCSPFNTELADAGTARLGVPTLVLREPDDLDELRALVRLTGRVLDADAAARALLADLDARVAALAARAGPRVGRRVLTYSNFGGTGWTAGADTMADQMIRLAGMHNAAAAAGKRGHERLTFEELIAIAPDVVVVAERFGEASSGTEAVLFGEPSLAGLAAVRQRAVVALHPRFFSSNSPEVVAGAERLADAVDALGLPR